MPPALVVNATTGFLDQQGSRSFSVFSSDKKVRFLELADAYRKETGKWPDLGSLCDDVGISIRSFYTHCEKDPVFKGEWEERLLRGEARLTSKLHDSSHPIAMLAWLRRYFPQRWNPEYKVTTEVSHTFTSELADRAQAIEVESVPVSANSFSMLSVGKSDNNQENQGNNPA